MTENPYSLNINQIQKFLPHRAPFLLIDRVLEIHPVWKEGSADRYFNDREFDPTKEDLISCAEVGTRVTAIKNVSYNEPYFQGHFPEFAIVPGVLIIETMAQAASFSVYPSLVKHLDRAKSELQCILIGVDNARFRKPLIPGDTLRIESEVVKHRGKLWVFQCTGLVDGQKVAEAELMANLVAKASY